MQQKRSLLKLTEHSELNTKITSKTWSFQARRQDSVTGGAEINLKGGTGSLFMCIREGHGGTRNLFQCGSNERGEDQKIKKRSSVQKFLQILVIVSKFLRFFTNSYV